MFKFPMLYLYGYNVYIDIDVNVCVCVCINTYRVCQVRAWCGNLVLTQFPRLDKPPATLEYVSVGAKTTAPFIPPIHTPSTHTYTFYHKNEYMLMTHVRG